MRGPADQLCAGVSRARVLIPDQNLSVGRQPRSSRLAEDIISRQCCFPDEPSGAIVNWYHAPLSLQSH